MFEWGFFVVFGYLFLVKSGGNEWCLDGVGCYGVDVNVFVGEVL